MNILIIEDDERIATFVQRGLQSDGFHAHYVLDGEVAQDLIVNSFIYDLVILDLMLPGVDGLTLLAEMRANKINVPVLILSAKRSVDERILGLQQGGDDYLTKPFSYSELLVRVQVLLRRASPKIESPVTVLEAHGVHVDLISRIVKREGVVIDIQGKELALLEIFMRNKDRILSKSRILEYLYGYSYDPQTNVIDVLIHRLRKRINHGFEKELIVNIRGTGYVFK